MKSVAGGTPTYFAYDGTELLLEHDSAGSWLQSYVFGPGTDEALVAYPSTQPGQRRFSHVDWLGSVVALSDNSGTAVAINAYDELGIPAAGNSGRFQYTGQAWLSELGLYHYKARTVRSARRQMAPLRTNRLG